MCTVHIYIEYIQYIYIVDWTCAAVTSIPHLAISHFTIRLCNFASDYLAKENVSVD